MLSVEVEVVNEELAGGARALKVDGIPAAAPKQKNWIGREWRTDLGDRSINRQGREGIAKIAKKSKIGSLASAHPFDPARIKDACFFLSSVNSLRTWKNFLPLRVQPPT